MKCFIGIDIGTFDSKGILIDEKGTILASSNSPHEMEIPEPGYAEHDAEKIWWGDFCRISKDLLQKAKVNPEDIKGIGCSAIGPTCLPVDSANVPLRKAILYGVDVRAKKQIDELNNELGEKYVLKRYGNPITSQSIGPKILWLKENEPDIYEKTAKFLTASSYIVSKLTDKFVIDRYTAAYFTPMYNLESNDWDYEILPKFCRADQMAECRWSNEIAGVVTEKAAKETGFAVGTPVTVGTADAGADAIGAGAWNPGDLLTMFGSSLFMIHVLPELKTDARYWAGPYHFKDSYMIASGMSTTGTLTRWFRDNFASEYVKEEQAGGENAYTRLTRDIEGVPAGSNGLIVLPYFSGERTPINDPLAKGMIFGLNLNHTKNDIYQACLEGVAYGIAQHLDGYKEIGIKTKRIIAVGGGTKADKWMQIVADVTGMEIYIGGVYGACYGDALLAAYATGTFKSISELEELVHIEKKVVPDFERTKFYRPYIEKYKELYKVTKDIMHSM